MNHTTMTFSENAFEINFKCIIFKHNLLQNNLFRKLGKTCHCTACYIENNNTVMPKTYYTG